MKKHRLDSEWYDVIDGQQMLTTIKIILKYLIKNYKSLETENKKSEFKLRYETRDQRDGENENKTEKFFDELDANNLKIDNENIDFSYISKVFETVTNWFKNQENSGEARVQKKEFLIH